MPKSQLTPTEYEVIRHLANGGDHIIAAELGIKTQTVKNHLANIRKKFDVYDRTQLILEALYLGEVTLDELIAPDGVWGDAMKLRRYRSDFQPLHNLPPGVYQCVRCAVLVGARYIKPGTQINLCVYCEIELKQEEKQEIEKDGIQLDS